jgi:hypothetical protein
MNENVANANVMVRSYAQWVRMEIHAENTNLKVQNLVKGWGKFHVDGDKNREISPTDVNNRTILSGESYVISACGRSGAGSGTDGNFDLFDGEVKVGNYHWSCPWGSKPNESTWTPAETAGDAYEVTVKGANLDSGALGNITIVCTKKV